MRPNRFIISTADLKGMAMWGVQRDGFLTRQGVSAERIGQNRATLSFFLSANAYFMTQEKEVGNILWFKLAGGGCKHYNIES